MNRNNLWLLLLITLIFGITGCIGSTTGSTIVTGKALPVTDPNDVNIYLEPPSQYETIGVIEASSDIEFSKKKAQDRVINKLKSLAAELGANGVLLMNTESKSDITGNINGMIIRDTTITAQGKAIHVIRE